MNNRATTAAWRPKVRDRVVHPAHGVGRVVSTETQEVVGVQLKLIVIWYERDKLTERTPLNQLGNVGLRPLTDPKELKVVMKALTTRRQVTKGMWSRRAAIYEGKLNSGNLGQVAEVVRDLYRGAHESEHSYSEWNLYERALGRLTEEVAFIKDIPLSRAEEEVAMGLEKAHGPPQRIPVKMYGTTRKERLSVAKD